MHQSSPTRLKQLHAQRDTLMLSEMAIAAAKQKKISWVTNLLLKVETAKTK
jgi:hypothetical protein